MERRFAVREQLTGVVRAALGAEQRLVDVLRLRGGTKKGVYRLVLDDGSTAIAYIWDATENYWPGLQVEDHADTFSPASGLELFEAASRYPGAGGH